MPEQPTDRFYEYSDRELSVRLPAYLRPKKGMRFFKVRSDKDEGRPLQCMSIEFMNDAGTEAVWSTIMNAKPLEWMGARDHIVRRGKADYLPDGLEVLMTNTASVRPDVHTYNILFLASGRRVYATFVGRGDLDQFDALCRAVVSSIRATD